MAAYEEFHNKVVVVTGASSGLGKAAAVLFAKNGASVVLCGRDNERLRCTMDICVQTNGGQANRLISVVADVTKSEDRKLIVDTTIEKFQQINMLVNSVGITLPEMGIENTTESLFDEVFRINVKSTFFMIQDALPHLEKAVGNIVNVSSILGSLTAHNRPVYPMTKAAVDHMTRCLALDLAPKGIRVNAVNPSHVPTRIYRHFGEDKLEELVQEGINRESQRQPLYGKCVTPEAVAETILFLASDRSSFVTGQCHLVDGGRHYNGALCRFKF